MSTLYCSIRKEQVAALPEELVRQRVLLHMTKERGFPSSLISVETPLRQMPHLSTSNLSEIPDRRVDVMCFGKRAAPKQGLYPLLIVECKAVRLTPRVLNQVAGYNHYIKAAFIAVVNDTEWQTGWFDPKLSSYRFVDYLPTYEDLVRSIHSQI